MKIQLLFNLCFIALTFSACGQKLTKSEALKVIQANVLEEPCYCKINTNTRSIWKSYKKDLTAYKDLEEKGIITTSSYKDRLSKLDRNGHTVVQMFPLNTAIYQYGFEEKGTGLGGAKAKVLYSTPKITEILGVSNSDNSREAIVLVKIVHELSPFASLIDNISYPSNCHRKNIEEKEITLIKYDTGWKIKN